MMGCSKQRCHILIFLNCPNTLWNLNTALGGGLRPLSQKYSGIQTFETAGLRRILLLGPFWDSPTRQLVQLFLLLSTLSLSLSLCVSVIIFAFPSVLCVFPFSFCIILCLVFLIVCGVFVLFQFLFRLGYRSVSNRKLLLGF